MIGSHKGELQIVVYAIRMISLGVLDSINSCAQTHARFIDFRSFY